MPNFFYKAKDRDGREISGDLAAKNERELIEKLDSQGYFPILIQLEKDKEGASFSSKVKRGDLAFFFRQLSDLLSSEMPLNEALSFLEKEVESEALRSIIGRISQKVKAGRSLSSALKDYPNIFDLKFTSLVRAGELGGFLSESLNRLASFIETEEDLRSRIRQTLIYPTFLLLVGFITIILLVTLLLPKLVSIFKDLDQILPLPTRILLFLSEFISQYLFFILAIFSFSFFGLFMSLKEKRVRLFLDSLLLSLPIIKEIVLKREMAKFSRTLGTLLKEGVPILEALEVSAEGITNKVLNLRSMEVIKEVRQGNTLAGSLKENHFPPLMASLIGIGEEGGFLEKSLLKVASSYEKELDRSLKLFISLLEPGIILIMGLIVGFIVLAMLLPIFRINLLVR